MLSIALATLLASANSGPSLSTSSACDAGAPATASQLPSTVSAVRLFKAWQQAIDTSDDAAFIRFVEDRGPVLLGQPEQWLDLRSILRGLQFCGVKSADAGAVELWIFDPTWDSYGVVQLKMGATATDKIEFIGLWSTDAVPAGARLPPKLALPELIEAVRTRAAERLAKDQFSGAVLLSRRGRVLFQQAYGLADRASHTPNTLDTQFRFGSIGKMFTIVAIMQLAEQGKLELDAPIGRYLKDYPNQSVATRVTVANLASHTGGTGDIFGPEFDPRKGSLKSLQDYVGLYGRRSPTFAPGSRIAYSNYGFILLGRIVEEVSGQSYHDYVQEKIFEPAGMDSTGNLPESTIVPRRAVGYMGYGARQKRADDTLPFSGTSAGGGYSTVGDFNRFVSALTSYRLLQRDTLESLITGGVTTDDGQFARFDFAGSMAGAGRYIGHTGGAPGISGALFHFLDSNVTVAVLSNQDPGTAESIALFAAHRMPLE